MEEKGGQARPLSSFLVRSSCFHAPISSFSSLWQTRLSLKQWGKNGMFLCLVKVEKNTAKTVYEQSCSSSDPKRSWSVKIYKIENVTVKKTFTGTDQTTWKRVKLRYFDWPTPVFLSNLPVNYVYSIFVIFLSCQCSLLLCVIKARVI